MYGIIKRLLDIKVSFILIILLSPLLLPLAIVLRFSAEGEVFYLQERMGLRNRKFKIYKFATMLKNSLNMGTGSITLKDDFRVTKLGKHLRLTKINEVPQLLNIILGHISFVGPRPILEQDWLLYPEEIRSKIYNEIPGLTGIGSIVFRDEESMMSQFKGDDPHEFYKRVVAPYKGELEMWYQKNKSFQLDLKILFLTFWVVFFPKNRAYMKWFRDLPEKPIIL